MVLRRENGSTIFAAYRYIFHCIDALEAEIHAIMQGMALAIQHSDCPVIVQSDSSNALAILSSDNLSRLHLVYGHLAAEIKAYLVVRKFVPLKVSRYQNRVAH
uniref:RNase H type-1 domain-containing protein n=1 Tax=Aegilops tauschii subsp. strangulata TaxID=200361 RepID=A0A453GDJ5_AEGTS